MVKANNQFMTKTRKAAERKAAAPAKPKVSASPEKKAPAKTMKSATTSAFQSSSSKTSRRAKKKIGKVKRIMKNREPKLLENDKNMMFLRGTKASQVIQDVMKELCQLKGELGKSLTRKNEIRPFEDASSLEFLSEKNDASLFAFGSHSKKRPNNLVLGRTFDHKILDMMELTVSNFVSMNEFNTSIIAGSKPTFIFKGTLFENDDTFINVKNLLLDTFRGKKYDQVSLNGIEWVICVSVDDETKKIHFRPYCIQLKNSGTRLPRVELEPLGPFIDFTLGRTQWAPDEVKKMSLKKPKGLEPNKVKNISRNVFGEKVGRIHMESQDLNKLQTRKMKGLKVRNGKGGERSEGEGEGEGEGGDGGDGDDDE